MLKELNDKNYSLGSELDSFKRKENQYLGDIERLNNTLRLKVEESSRWQTEYNELIGRYQDLENKSSSGSSEFQKLQLSYNMIVGEYENSKKHLSEYEQR